MLEDAAVELMARTGTRPTRPGLRGVWLALLRASDDAESAVSAAALEAAAEAVRQFEAGRLDEADALAALKVAAAALEAA